MFSAINSQIQWNYFPLMVSYLAADLVNSWFQEMYANINIFNLFFSQMSSNKVYNY